MTNSLIFSYEAHLMFRANAKWHHGREPVLRRMPNGDLISIFYSGGRTEPDPGNVAAIVRSDDDGKTWSEPCQVFAHDTRCVYATEIFTEGMRPFAAVHTYEYGGYFSELRASFSVSDDSGLTWGEPFTIKGVPPNFCVRQGRLLSDGTWIFPVYWVEQDAGWNFDLRKVGISGIRGWRFSSAVIRSHDLGQTFSLGGYQAHPVGFWEPDVIETHPGRLVMFLRCDQGGVLWRSDSPDFGVTWTPAEPTDIPNPGSKIVLFQIEGKTVLAHNPTSTGRRVLELWVSEDRCATWRRKIRLAEIATEGSGAVEEPITKLGNWTTDIICYPHGFADENQRLLYLACDSVHAHYLLKIPFADILKG